jgi:hypothetical protein
MYASKVIVKVGVELGSIALHGMQAERGWKFVREVNDQTPDLLDEEPIHTKSETVDTWAAALKLLDKYPWATFYPVFVDPDFKREIWDAVTERLKDDSETSRSEWEHPLERWRAVCEITDVPKNEPPIWSPAAAMQPRYRIIHQADFERHPKSRKPQDRDRMLNSSVSEDWVTWTAFRLLESLTPQTWWLNLVTLAKADNPSLALPLGWEQTPLVKLWDLIASPAGYEKASRERMRRSDNPVWNARSANSSPVEGKSEIDVTLRNCALVVFAEAKLCSDISTGTTYDPLRDQIVRNIDCALDQAGNQIPIFWMLVRDIAPSRLYTTLLHGYLSNPDTLIRKLQHHDPVRVVALAKNLSIILWKDLLEQVIQLSVTHDDEIRMVAKELALRIGACFPD